MEWKNSTDDSGMDQAAVFSDEPGFVIVSVAIDGGRVLAARREAVPRLTRQGFAQSRSDQGAFTHHFATERDGWI